MQDADLEWAKEQLARCKRRGLGTVVGGPISSSQDPALAEADHVVDGEAEEVIAELAADLERGAAQPQYKAAQLPDLTQVPLPHLHLASLRTYSAMAVQYSRGCPFNCEFCDIIEIYGRRPRTKTPDQICAELEQIYRLGWRGPVFLVDDNFIGNKKNVRILLPRMVEWMRDHRFPFSLFTEASFESGRRFGTAGANAPSPL